MNARHAAAEGSFARSAGGAAGRGMVLVAVAVVLGVVLMRWSLDGPGDGVIAGPVVTTVTDATTGPPATTSDGSTVPTTAGGETTVAPTPLSPETVKVVVANGTATTGVAGNFTDQLNLKAYVTEAATNANVTTYTASVVYYAAGFATGPQAAQQVANELGITAPPEPMPALVPLKDPAALVDAQVLVVIGADKVTPTT